jgi:iron complex outermembrane receptor protein
MKRVYQHEGVGASLRTYALGQKLVTSLSTRYSYTDADIINRLTPAQSGKSDEDGLIYSLGANYKLNGDAAVLYANTSTSYEPSVTYDKGLGRPIAAETGKGVEAGLKGSFLDHTFNYTVSLYQITKQNIREVNPDYDDTVPGSPQYLTAGEVRVRGGEVVATMVPTKSLTVIATFGYTDAEVTHDDPANEPTTVGQRPLYVPAYTASLLASYAFSGGALDGLRVRLNTTYTGDRVSQYDDTRSTNPGKREYITPSLTLVSAGVSYDIKQRGRIRHTLSLDVQNLLDKEYFTPGNFTLGRGRSYSATYRLNF